MPAHVLVLDASRDQEFLKQQRRDPVIKELLKAGDRVVVCAHCRLVFLEDTWTEIRGRFRHGAETLPNLPGTPNPFSRRPTPPPTPEPVQTGSNRVGANQPAGERPIAEPTPRNNVTAEPRRPATRAEEPTPEPSVTTPQTRLTDALTLREIPFQLREIPFALREIRPY
jgi:hypothetical protein